MPEINRQCEHCGKSFSVRASRLKHGRGKTCSRTCQYLLIKSREHRAETATRVCVGCGTAFERLASMLRHKRGAGKYCTRVCRNEHRVGPLSPNWQDGSGVYKRGPRWYAIRRKVLERDGCCQQCGATEYLHVHHEVPFRMFDDHKEANALGNLVTLCASCHRTIEAKFRWVKFEEGCLRIPANGAVHELARERGMMS